MISTKRYADLKNSLFLLPYFLIFSLFLLIPLFYGFGLSFFRWEMLSPAGPEFIGLSNYGEALSSEYFLKATWATFRFVIGAVPLSVGFALLIALGINSVAPKRQEIYRALVFFPSLITISVVGILWRWFYHGDFGLFNAFLGYFGMQIPWITDAAYAMKSIILMTLWWTIGGPMIILIAGLKQIPQQYYEAASIDGANRINTFLHITLPQLKNVLFFVTIMNIIGAFQVFGQTYMVTRGGPELSTRVLVQYIYETAFRDYRMGYGAAMSWLLFLMIAVFSFIQFRVSREKKK